MTREEEFARAVEALPAEITLTVGRGQAIALITVVQLASRHPQAARMKTVQAAVRMARDLQEALEAASPGLGPLLELGWDPANDVPCKKGG